MGERRAAAPAEELGALFDREYPRLRTLAFGMLGDRGRAEEVTMDAFVKAFSSWARFARAEWPEAYLRATVMNLCRSRIRRKGVELRLNALVHRRGALESPEWEAARSDMRLDLWSAVRRLPPRQRACVVLRYLDDMTEPEIAETLRCSVGTVKAHLSRARRSLGKSLARPDTGGERA